MSENLPVRVRLTNDYDVVVAGLRAMLEPFADRINVVEADVHGTSESSVDLTLYDTFGRAQIDQSDLDDIIADPRAGSVVVFSWNTREALVTEALAKGARGYLEKSLTASALVDALVRVAAGEMVTPDGVAREPSGGDFKASSHDAALLDGAAAQTDVSSCGPAWPGREEGLSLREAEVVALITQGCTNPEIAARLFLTVNSVKTYIRSAYRKMKVERRTQAVRWGIEHGMLPDSAPHEV